VSKVHCGGAFWPGASQSPKYCAPIVCVPNFPGGLAAWWQPNKQTNKKTNKQTAAVMFMNDTIFENPQAYMLNLKWKYDDDCFYYHSWRNNVVIEFGSLSSFLI